MLITQKYTFGFDEFLAPLLKPLVLASKFGFQIPVDNCSISWDKMLKLWFFLAWNMSGDDTSPIFAECLLYLSYKLDNNKQPLSECPIKCCYWKLQLVIFNPFMGIAIILLICWYFRMTVMTPLFTIRTTSGYLYTSYSLLLYSICQDVFGLWWRGASWSSLAKELQRGKNSH